MGLKSESSSLWSTGANWTSSLASHAFSAGVLSLGRTGLTVMVRQQHSSAACWIFAVYGCCFLENIILVNFTRSDMIQKTWTAVHRCSICCTALTLSSMMRFMHMSLLKDAPCVVSSNTVKHDAYEPSWRCSMCCTAQTLSSIMRFMHISLLKDDPCVVQLRHCQA